MGLFYCSTFFVVAHASIISDTALLPTVQGLVRSLLHVDIRENASSPHHSYNAKLFITAAPLCSETS